MTDEERRLQAQWDHFLALTDTEHQAAYVRTLLLEDEGALQSDDDAFEYLSDLVNDLQEAGDFAEALSLLDLFEQQRPHVYADLAPYADFWRFEIAVLSANGAEVQAAQRYARTAAETWELAEEVVEHLLFHNHLAPAYALLLDHGDQVDADGEYGPPDAGDLTYMLYIDRALAAGRPFSPDDPTTLRALQRLTPEGETLEDVAREARWCYERVTPHGRRTWNERNLAALAGNGLPGGPNSDASDRAWDDVTALVAEFFHELRARHGWSRGRSLLVVKSWPHALEFAARKGASKPASMPAKNVLLPEPNRLKKAFDVVLDGDCLFSHRTAANALALPLWADFLAARGLIEHDLARQRVETFWEKTFGPAMRREPQTHGRLYAQACAEVLAFATRRQTALPA